MNRNDVPKAENANAEILALQKDKGRLTAKFVLGSTAGLLLFLIPLPYSSGSNIGVSVLSSLIRKGIDPITPWIGLVVCYLSGLGGLWVKLAKPAIVEKSPLAKRLLNPGWVWLVFRLCAIVISTMVLLGFGPEWLISADTGGQIAKGVVRSSIAILGLCAFLLPLLTEFGLMEFIGVLCQSFFRKVFRIPGRAAVDCLSSWLGVSNVAVLLTDSQYVHGRYTRREAVVIMTCFSAVSVSSTIVYLDFCDIGYMFVPFYAIVCLLGVVCAIIIPRIPPVSRYANEYYNGIDNSLPDEVPAQYKSKLQYAYYSALEKARDTFTLKSLCKDGVNTLLSVLFNITPGLITIGTLALVIANYTPVFEILGTPFIPLFNLFRIPEATQAAQALMGGFADNYIPAILAGGTMTNPLTQFIVCLVAYNSIIYMSGPGAVMSQSETNIGVGKLFIIYLLRVILTILVGCPISMLVFRLMGVAF